MHIGDSNVRPYQSQEIIIGHCLFSNIRKKD